MSAIAFIITPHKTFLYSDGLAIDNNGVEWHNNRKCFKINDHLGVMAVGRWRTGLSEEIIEKITRKGCKTAREAAQIAAPMMRAGLDGICFEDPENPKCSAVLWTFGFEGGPTCYMVDYKITGCAPKKINITAMPFVGAMIYGNFGGGNPYMGHLSRCLGQNISMQQAGEQAFKKMIADYIDTGKVNEHIYRETIKRPPVPG